MPLYMHPRPVLVEVDRSIPQRVKVLLQEALFVGLTSSFGKFKPERRADSGVQGKLVGSRVRRVVVDLGSDVDALMVDLALNFQFLIVFCSIFI